MENKADNESEWTFNWATIDTLSCFPHKVAIYVKSDYKEIVTLSITTTVIQTK